MSQHKVQERQHFIDHDPACSTEDGRAIAGRAFDAGYIAGYQEGVRKGGEGKMTLERARELAATYDGGEGNHPLARHRDSMG